MLISELIRYLTAVKGAYGDIPVMVYDPESILEGVALEPTPAYVILQQAEAPYVLLVDYESVPSYRKGNKS